MERSRSTFSFGVLTKTTVLGLSTDNTSTMFLLNTRPLLPTYAFGFPCFWISCCFLLLIFDPSVVRGLSQIS